MKLDTLNGTPVTPSISERAGRRRAAPRATIASGPRKPPNWATSSEQHRADRQREHAEQLPERLPAGSAYCPPISSVTPAGSATRPSARRTSAHHAAQAAAARPAGDRDVRAAGSPAGARWRRRCRAPARAGPAGASRRGRRSARGRRHPPSNANAVGQAGPGSAPAGRAHARCRHRAPNSAARAWACHLGWREPQPCDPRRVELDPALGIVALHAVEQVHQPGRRLDRLRPPPRAARSAARLIAAEQLELDRLRRAGQVADHVLHQLHELHPHRRRPLLRGHRAPGPSPRTPTAAARAA